MAGKGANKVMPQWVLGLVVATCGLLCTLANLVALAWFGMWMGLNSRNGLMGTLKTIVLVQIVPWMVMWFVAMMTMVAFAMLNVSKKTSWIANSWVEWFPIVSTLLMTVLLMGKNFAFYMAARKKMVDQFRDVAVRAVAPMQRHQRVAEIAKAKPPITKPPVMETR